MKKNDIFLGTSVLLYSILFYHQSLGINFLLFSIIQIVFFYLLHKENAKKIGWKLSALGVLSSSIAIFLYGSTLGLIANIVSLGVLAFSSIAPGTSYFMGIFHNVYSTLSSCVFVVYDLVNKVESPDFKGRNSKRIKGVFIFIIAFIIVMLFFALYRSANSMFKDITDKIDLSFISWPWIGFTFLGFLLLYALYNYRTIPQFQKFDLESENDLQQKENNSFFDNLLSIPTERSTGITLFIMLNLLLLFVNALDIVFLYGGEKMPEGMGYSDIVHQGVNALITSIIMAVGIILFFFRGRLNFIRDNKLIRYLSYFWILQNTFIIISTAYRNQLYISEYLLTYKRIGVFVYLLLCVIGLIFTFVKIKNIKTNWYIVRNVSKSFYIILFTSSLINWDQFIVNYNFESGKNKIENIDFDYLLNLSSKTLPSTYLKMNELNPSLIDEYKSVFEFKIGKYFNKVELQDWRSFNLSNYATQKKWNEIFSESKLSELIQDSPYNPEQYRSKW